MTRQAAFAARHRARGLCVSCSAKAFSSGLCLKHYERRLDLQRRPEVRLRHFLYTIALVDGHEPPLSDCPAMHGARRPRDRRTGRFVRETLCRGSADISVAFR